jgi:error-prone DNA polymerase
MDCSGKDRGSVLPWAPRKESRGNAPGGGSGAKPPAYAELQVATGFSFLRGASHAHELVQTAAALGLAALGIADRNTVAGVVRAHEAAKEAGLRLLVGSRLAFRDGTPDVLCYPQDRPAWGRLTRLLTAGNLRGKKGECLLDYSDLLTNGEGPVLLVIPPDRLDKSFREKLQRLAADFRGSAYLAASRRYYGDDAHRLRALAGLAAAAQAPMVATNDVLYHTPERRALQDVLTCIREGCTIAEAGFRLQPNAERHLKSPAEMARLFRDHPGAIARTVEITQRCRFSLDELAYEYPNEPVPPGRTPDEHLAVLAWEGAAARFPQGISDKLRETLEKELRIIAQLNYARYFLTVHDIVRFARSRGILCQGRGSAANSVLCYCLGVTAVDPTEIDLLFERFVSTERREPPDIDVDFEHERREEVIQYIYNRYGRHRAGIAATVIHYRPKMAIREVGKVLGLTEDATAALSAQSWNAGETLWSGERLREVGLDPGSPIVQRAVALARDLVGLPRHLSQHVGGFVLTRGRLDETVPIGNAAMDGRTFIEWDKDDIDTLGIMKVDVLALGMLTCIRKGFELLQAQGEQIRDLADIPREDGAVYEMLARGDSLGVFQVESRAQMNMLPRLKPREFYDLVIEVAIVRPGPIQGDMVHPYLRRRQGLESKSFPPPSPEQGPADELERVLGRTMGVPLFQEQAMRIAIVAAKFTPEEANQLRRAMATFRHVGTIHKFAAKMIDGMVDRGYARDFAERCFRQIEGFGTYGFPESHAASFAHLVYVSAWLKCHHPAAFACALLNSQPMGFYAPAQIVRDAREHGVPVRGVDVNASSWDCALEGGALRLGLRQITGFQKAWAEQLVQARGPGFSGFAALAASGLPLAALALLAGADALRSLGLDRRAALWQVQGLRDEQQLPLFASLPVSVREARLPAMPLPEQVITDYQTTSLSLKAHPLRFLRPALAAEGVLSCAEATQLQDGARVRVAGIVLVRQRPGNGNVVFATIEDETGVANVVVWSSLLERFHREVVAARLLLVEGVVQRSPEDIVHVVAERLHDRSAALNRLFAEAPALLPSRGPAHPRAERPITRSRDFH